MPDRSGRQQRTSGRLLTLAALVMLVAGALLWWQSGSDNAASTKDAALISTGAAIYAEHCQICHGAAGQGGTGPALSGNLAERYPDINAQKALILSGPNAMPSFAGRLTDQEVDAVIVFTRTGL